MSVALNDKRDTYRHRAHDGIEDAKCCGIAGCEKDAKNGMTVCSMHYMRKRRTGTYDRNVAVNLRIDRMTPMGLNLTALRMLRGWSVGEAAKRCGLSQSRWTQICGGDSTTLHTVSTIASVLGVEVWEILKPGQFVADPPPRIFST